MKKLLFTLALIAIAGHSFAQENATEEKPQPSAAVEALQLVGGLVQYGYENYSATALIQAVELYNTIELQDGDVVKTSAGEGTEDAKEQKVSIDVKALLKDAREFADGNAVVLAYLESVENVVNQSSATLGRVNGPSETEECVLANDTDIYRIRFRGGEDASVLVIGDHDTDLDLYIYDENGNLIDSDTDTTDTCLCEWTPKWTGYFTIKIRNLGSVRNYYTLYTN